MDDSKKKAEIEPARHYLKIHPQYLKEKIEGNKLFEVRRNDRNFQKGDIVVYEILIKQNNVFMVLQYEYEITYVCMYEQKPNYVVFGEKPLFEVRDKDKIEEERKELGKSHSYLQSSLQAQRDVLCKHKQDEEYIDGVFDMFNDTITTLTFLQTEKKCKYEEKCQCSSKVGEIQ